MNIVFNGQSEVVEAGITLQALLEAKSIAGTFAIAVNESFVPKSSYGETSIAENDEIECVHAVQGG